MTIRTAVIDTADWRLAIPIQASDAGVDFSGTRLTIDITPERGGEPIATANSDDETLMFVPAVGVIPAYFALDLRVKDRTWRIGKPTKCIGDVLRRPDPAFPLYVEWLGRLELVVHPGSGSTGIRTPGYGPVLVDAQPYDGRIVAAPMLVGFQGPPAYPVFDPILDEGKALRIVGGVPTWI